MASLSDVKQYYEEKSNSVTKFVDVIVNCPKRSMITIWSLSSERYADPGIIGEIVQDKLSQFVCKRKSLYSAYARGWEFSHTYQLGNDQITQIRAHCPMLLPSER